MEEGFLEELRFKEQDRPGRVKSGGARETMKNQRMT